MPAGTEGFGTREMFASACRIAHVSPRILLEAGDPQSLIALVEAGRGVGIVPSTVRLARRKVRGVPVLHARASLGIWGWIVWDPKRPPHLWRRLFQYPAKRLGPGDPAGAAVRHRACPEGRRGRQRAVADRMRDDGEGRRGRAGLGVLFGGWRTPRPAARRPPPRRC